jgi:ribonuclease-3
MTGSACTTLIDLLRAPDPDLDRIISTFVSCFNTVYSDPASDHWDITQQEWQRYEFLGDRVLSLIIAQWLFTQRHAPLTEGEMTRFMSRMVSNRALDMLLKERAETSYPRLIPPVIGEQNSYGERITGGAFEAFIGALYCELGLDEVAQFVIPLMKGSSGMVNGEENAVGLLQEYFQKRYRSLPMYRETKRTGPDNKRDFTVEVLFNNEILGEGSGSSLLKAKQVAAGKALGSLGLSDTQTTLPGQELEKPV